MQQSFNLSECTVDVQRLCSRQGVRALVVCHEAVVGRCITQYMASRQPSSRDTTFRHASEHGVHMSDQLKATHGESLCFLVSGQVLQLVDPFEECICRILQQQHSQRLEARQCRLWTVPDDIQSCSGAWRTKSFQEVRQRLSMCCSQGKTALPEPPGPGWQNWY